MADIEKKKQTLEADERVFDLWCKKNPKFNATYKEKIIKVLCDFNVGANQYSESKAKILGAGYEAFIMAFFIGLYSGHRVPLGKGTPTDDLNWPIDNWSGTDRGGRKRYKRLTLYMFVALVAKVDVDWLAVDKGQIPVSQAVTDLTVAMEEYANYGFSVIEDIMREGTSFFCGEQAFFDLINEILKDKMASETASTGPESLD